MIDDVRFIPSAQVRDLLQTVFPEIPLQSVQNIFIVDVHVEIPIVARLLVNEADGVHQFVEYDAHLKATPIQRQMLHSALQIPTFCDTF